MSKILTIRLTDEEEKAIQNAATAAAQPGDRKVVSGWARRVLLREAVKAPESK